MLTLNAKLPQNKQEPFIFLFSPTLTLYPKTELQLPEALET